MSREIQVHNPESGAQVFTEQGHIISGHQTRPSRSDDRVTLRLLGRGRLLDVTPVVAPQQEPVHITQPAGNASTEDWREYALSQGLASEEVAQAGREEIKDLLGLGSPPAPEPEPEPEPEPDESPIDPPAESDIPADTEHGDTVHADQPDDETEK